MKLVRFEADGRRAIGAFLDEDQVVVDLALAAGEGEEAQFPASMAEFLARGDAGLLDAVAAVQRAAADSTWPVKSVRLLAPIGDPNKILCIGQNYKDHCEEQNQPLPERAILFAKYSTALNDPDGVVRLPRVTTQVDYECELAVVIGGKGGGGRDIPEAEALNHVAGYMCSNDVSARDIQLDPREKQWIRGKSPDGFYPIGPWLVTPDEIPDPHDLDISLTLNGQVRQSSNTCNLVFKIPYLIANLSETMTLLPGDIISTGTPGGVGMYSKPQVFLKPGDTMTVTIARLGSLTNTVA
ncbi:MAG TPA: fumarylacetoacetate hydrolase family protein [Chthonomonadaceae bacterium]|nr:fumarylacetoacetate hydrolase family protein [Chthonomonadaceae bacterium]